MLQAVLSQGVLIELRFEILDFESVKKWYLKRGFKKSLRKESNHCLTVGRMKNGCFIQGEYKNIWLSN